MQRAEELRVIVTKENFQKQRFDVLLVVLYAIERTPDMKDISCKKDGHCGL